MRIIASSSDRLRLVCEVCGAHKIVSRQALPPVVICSTCAATRAVHDRRQRDLQHVPDRRRTPPSV